MNQFPRENTIRHFFTYYQRFLSLDTQCEPLLHRLKVYPSFCILPKEDTKTWVAYILFGHKYIYARIEITHYYDRVGVNRINYCIEKISLTCPKFFNTLPYIICVNPALVSKKMALEKIILTSYL